MLDEKLQNLAKEFPEYSDVFDAVLVWFESHPNINAISMDTFYSNKFGFSESHISIAFTIMKHTKILTTIYRVLDEDGSKIGRDFNEIDEIPSTLDTMSGQKKEIEDVFIVPYYSINKQGILEANKELQISIELIKYFYQKLSVECNSIEELTKRGYAWIEEIKN